MESKKMDHEQRIKALTESQWCCTGCVNLGINDVVCHSIARHNSGLFDSPEWGTTYLPNKTTAHCGYKEP